MSGPASGQVTTYHWNRRNQLTGIDLPPEAGGAAATYRYDALGRRIEKDVDGAVTRYVHDGDDIAIETDDHGSLLRRYRHSDGIDEPLVLEEASGESFYYHRDHLGSVVMVTDEAGQVAAEYEYDAYGNREAISEDIEQPYAFTGREWDGESGLYYYRARYYDPMMGRFLSEDPIGFGGGDANLYRYVGNNPINLRDPSGQIPVLALPWALPVLIDALAAAVPYAIGGTAAVAAAAACLDRDEEKPKCRFEREVYYSGPTKTCVYSKQGQMFTFPQWKEKSCPPIDPVTCLVDTTGMPGSTTRLGGK